MPERSVVVATPELGDALTNIPDGGVGIAPLRIRIGHCGMSGYKPRRTLRFFNAVCHTPRISFV